MKKLENAVYILAESATYAGMLDDINDTAAKLVESATHLDMFNDIGHNATDIVEGINMFTQLSNKRRYTMKTFRKTAFTLAEGATHVDICDNIRKCAFTLAEVLITLGIIGVVAAITIPPLVTNLTERINSERQANIALKFTKAMENMKALGLLHNYESTDAFVDELQKHMKIAKRCGAENIADCWPTAKVTDNLGKEYEVSKAKKGENLKVYSNQTDNVGLVLDDGAAVILTYNENNEGMDVTDAVTADFKTLPVGFGKSKDFAYTSSVTSAIDFVMDVNGAKGPNSETVDGKYHDIRSFKAARFGNGCTEYIPEIGCVYDLGYNYSAINTCNDTTYDSSSTYYSNKTCSSNYWAGAIKACKDLGMELPNRSTLINIYNKQPNNSGLTHWGASYWASEQLNSDYAYHVYSSNDVRPYTKYSKYTVLCIDK